MSTPPISEKWVPLWPLSDPPTQLPPSINGRWLKGGVGGAMSWEVIPGLAADADTGWHILGAAGEPGLQNGWQNYPNPYGPARFRKLTSGLVTLEGLMNAGVAGATAFILPVGYRPMPQGDGSLRDHIFQTAMGGNLTGESARCGSNGDFRPSNASAVPWIALNGIVFYGW